MNDDFVTLWTIQPIEWYESLLKNKHIFAKPTLSDQYMDNDPTFRQAYDWLIIQMEKRIKAKPCKNILPIWAWYQHSNSDKKRPDLRYSGLLPKGTKGVRIKLKKKKSEVLFSDFDLWHSVLNYWYIADDEQDHNDFFSLLNSCGLAFTERDRYPSHIQKQVEESWQKIFDMDYCQEYSAKSFKNKSIQATFWDLFLDEVVSVDKFIAR